MLMSYNKPMSKKEIVAISGLAKPPSPFNHVVRVGELIFLSSQLSVDLHTHTLLAGTIAQQTRKALENIAYLLDASGSNMENVAKVVIYMRDVAQFEEMNAVYKEFFHDGQEPARVTVQAPSPLSGIDIEIEVTAVVVK